MNPIIEGRIKMQELFDKIERILNENFEVINKVPVKKENDESFLEGNDYASVDGTN